MHSNSLRPCKVPNKIHAKVLLLGVTPPPLELRKNQHHLSHLTTSPAISPSGESYFHFGGDWNSPRPKRISLSTEITSLFLGSSILCRQNHIAKPWFSKFSSYNPTWCLTQTVFLGPILDINNISLFRWPCFFELVLRFLQKNHGFLTNPPSPDDEIPCFSPCPPSCCRTFFVFFQKNDDPGKKMQKNPFMSKSRQFVMRES